jgi:hypothetical protein
MKNGIIKIYIVDPAYSAKMVTLLGNESMDFIVGK